jgi:hypothetical protein
VLRGWIRRAKGASRYRHIEASIGQSQCDCFTDATASAGDKCLGGHSILFSHNIEFD